MIRGTRVPLPQAVALEESPPRALGAGDRKLLQEAGRRPRPPPGPPAPDLRPRRGGGAALRLDVAGLATQRRSSSFRNPAMGTPAVSTSVPRLQTRRAIYPMSQDGPTTDTGSAFPVLRGPGRAPWAWLAPQTPRAGTAKGP